MQKSETEIRLVKIFKQLFPGMKDPGESTSSADVKGWDSLKHVMLISEIEKEFDIKFSLDDMLSMRTFGEIKAAVESKA